MTDQQFNQLLTVGFLFCIVFLMGIVMRRRIQNGNKLHRKTKKK